MSEKFPLHAMTTLSRQHYKRLRFYWQGRANGGAGTTDGIDPDLAALGLVERFERFGSGVCFRIMHAGVVLLASACFVARRTGKRLSTSPD
ncbi:hypothetical protein BamIOP4010DRAFT_0596 [Burkholderia ambifaria IOP40-10]|uniref:Uncharacterized protein n=1 Tax=Burkholderia ambifaria IOP40-10 TaxID=396596 RepID=B1F987_9BURK|nr:hypothetical protein [Burkholderia ambifaria]EDT05859.1 hypothetical protein BamIOP4010DRAFT_0596 [Burkholderia ambifaria IOP40-10]